MGGGGILKSFRILYTVWSHTDSLQYSNLLHCDTTVGLYNATLSAILLPAVFVACATQACSRQSLSSWPPRTSCRRRAVLLSLLPALSIRQTRQRSWTILWRWSRSNGIAEPFAANSDCTSPKPERKCMARSILRAQSARLQFVCGARLCQPTHQVSAHAQSAFEAQER